MRTGRRYIFMKGNIPHRIKLEGRIFGVAVRRPPGLPQSLKANSIKLKLDFDRDTDGQWWHLKLGRCELPLLNRMERWLC